MVEVQVGLGQPEFNEHGIYMPFVCSVLKRTKQVRTQGPLLVAGYKKSILKLIPRVLRFRVHRLSKRSAPGIIHVTATRQGRRESS